MFNFIRRKFQKVNYTLIARYRTGYWLKSFEIKANSSHEACRKFDTGMDALYWIRVSGATEVTTS